MGKKLGIFLNAAKYLWWRTICYLFPEKMLFISVLWARNLSHSEKNFSKKVLSFSFFVGRGHFGTFYQRFKLFLDLSLNVWASAEQFSTVFLKVHLRWGSVFLEPDLFLSKVGQKICGCFVKAAENVRRRTICHLFPEKMFFISLLWPRNLSDSAKNFSKKVLSFSFFVGRGHFGTFYQRFKLFLDLSLNVWASAEQFSTVSLKVHLRCGSVFLEPDLFLSKVGQKSCGCFVKAAENVRRRSIWYLFPEEMLFLFLYFERKTSRLWEKLLQKVLSFSFFVCKKKLGNFFSNETFL